MIRCPEANRLQSLLDGELSPAEESGLRRHALGCPECAAELALYERVFAALAAAPTWDPGPELTERILSRVLPSQVRRRWLRAIGWGYGIAAAGSVAGFTMLLLSPLSRPLLAGLAGLAVEAPHRVAQALVFVLDALAFAAVQLTGAWAVVLATAARFAPVARAIASLLSRPGVDLVLLTATVASGLLLWWMRPREAHARRARSHREIGHVGLLGF